MFRPTQSIVNELREGFSADKCVAKLLEVVTAIAKAIGVTIETRIVNTDTSAEVDRAVIMKSMGDMTAVMSAIIAGSRIDLRKAWEMKNVEKPTS